MTFIFQKINTNYPPLISIDHESNPRVYETPYNTFVPYPDYATSSKLEAFDYNYWPANTTTTTTTHNILAEPSSLTTDHIPTPSSSTTNQTLERIGSNSPVHLSQINSTTTISATHHHHHIHQHLYPLNENSNWLTATEYQSPNGYRHYSYPNNNLYDQPQWSTPAPALPIKFESSYSPPSYYESAHHLEHPLSINKEEPSDSSYTKCPEQSSNWYKSQLTPVPPKNPANGMSHMYID